MSEEGTIHTPKPTEIKVVGDTSAPGEDLKENQEKPSGWGGKREGSGRPKGSTKDSLLAEQIKNELGDQKIPELVKMACERAYKSDKLLIFLLEQVFGKAKQTNHIAIDEDDVGLDLIKQALYGARKTDTTIQDKRPADSPVADTAGDIQGDTDEKSPEGPSDTADPVREVPDSSPSSPVESSDVEGKVADSGTEREKGEDYYGLHN